MTSRRPTQAQLAAALEMQQSAISRLERQTDLYLSTLRGYVEVMGGSLHLEAVFPDARAPIITFGSLAEPPAAVDERADRSTEHLVVHDRPSVARGTPAA